MSQYSTEPAQIAAALHALASRIAQGEDLAPARIAASLTLQLHEHWGTQPERVAAVEALSAAIGMATADRGGLYGTPPGEGDTHGLGPVNVSIFTAIKSQRETDLERENAELRAQLAANGEQA